MNHSIKPGVIPPPPGLEKEEPEFAQEEDIASDDPVRNDGTGDEPLREAQRE